jgi:hypothetical protein
MDLAQVQEARVGVDPEGVLRQAEVLLIHSQQGVAGG